MLNFTYSDENPLDFKEIKMRNLLIWVKERPMLCAMLRAFSCICVALFAAAAVFAVYSAYSASVLSAAGLLLSLGVPFIAVTLLRRAVNASRPYEIYPDIFDTPPRHGIGESFPSRHAFSSFAIAVCMLPVSTLVGCILLLLATLVCVSRVALGIHFIRDVVTGALIGIISQIIGLLLIQPF